MRSVDTNVLVRLITRDDVRQTASAEAFVSQGAWVSVLALAEAVWVLDAVYERGTAEIATAVEMLLNHRDLVLQDADAAAAALETFRKRPALSSASAPADRCMQIHGGMGLTLEMPIQRMWKQRRSSMITEGAVEVMRLVLAREVLRSYG